MTETPLIRMRGITKRFPGVVALRRVDFDLYPGEVVALAGENGSGKSTLSKCLYGTITPDEGTIEIEGHPVEISSPRRALELGVVAITQELTLAPTLSVTENVLMGRLPKGRFGVDWSKAHSLAREALDSVGVEIDERAIVATLSTELQQEVEIARAVSAQSRVLILDEATSSLSEVHTEKLMQKIEQLRTQGVGIIFISHRLRELYRCASRSVVLRDGVLVGTYPLPATAESMLVSRMVGRDMEDLYSKRKIEKAGVTLEVRNVSTLDGAVRDVSLDVHRGEILGIAGLVGSGKELLGKALFGAVPASGSVVIDGKKLKMGDPRAAMDAGIGFVPEDRKLESLLLTRGTRANLSLPWSRGGATFNRLGFLRPRTERKLTVDWVERFRVRVPSVDHPIVNLSRGNQQKVVLARWFALSPKAVILMEPTRGIDVGAKSEVYVFIQDLAARGVAVLMVSSEMPELLGLADRILVMYHGEVCGEFDPAETSEEELAHALSVGAQKAEEVLA